MMRSAISASELYKAVKEARDSYNKIQNILKDPTIFQQHAFVQGRWVESKSGHVFEVKDPATRNLISTVPDMSKEDTKMAIEAAHNAFPMWKSKTAKERGQLLRAWYDLIIANKDDIATILTLENGKPKREALAEVVYGAGFLDWYSEEARRIYGDIIPHTARDRRQLVIKQPIGVAGMITPWNFPIAMITRKVAPALAVGCTVVLKPAMDTPLCALALCVLAERAGIPAGVLNVITSSKSKDLGEEMTGNPLVRKLSFTGSTKVGKALYKQCADTMKRISFELGGNAPFIIFEDANIDSAIKGLIACKFRGAGQTCVCANRIYVHNDIYDRFTAQLSEAIANMKLGHGLQEGVELGPLNNLRNFDKVKSLEQDAVSKGAKLILGGTPQLQQWQSCLTETEKRDFLFYPPTILTEMNLDMRITHEEIFGPICALYRFNSETEVIRLANSSEYGLAGYFYSNDISRIFRVAEALDCGLIGVNEGIISTEVAPFGGMKQSGIGREGSYYGAEEYLDIKYICIGGLGQQ